MNLPAAAGTMPLGDPEIVELNVGGVHFSTTRTTLIGRAVEPHGTMLSAMFSRAPTSLPSRLDRAGRVFIDRDGARFGCLLNYLRSGALTGADAAMLDGLREEAAFFGLLRLVGALDAEIAQRDLEDDLENMPPLSQGSAAGSEAASEPGTPTFDVPAAGEAARGGVATAPVDYTFTLSADF